MGTTRFAHSKNLTDQPTANLFTGLDMIYEAVTYFLRDENLKFWHKNFMLFGKPGNPYTLEAKAFGDRMIFTVDPENIKAVLATQFNDFGKGKQFNDDWHEFLGDSKGPCSHSDWRGRA